MNKKVLIAGLMAFIAATQAAQPWKLLWTPSTSDTNGWLQSYNFYYEQDTNQTGLTLLGTSPAGTTNLYFYPTNYSNPCYIVGQVTAINSNVSAFSTPLLFDTNAYPQPFGGIQVHP